MAKPLTVSIECPGDAIGTIVRDVATGQVLRGVERAFIVIDAATGTCFAKIRFALPEIRGSFRTAIDEDHLRQLADALGFDLVRRAEDGK